MHKFKNSIYADLSCPILPDEFENKDLANQNTIARFPAKTKRLKPIVSKKFGMCSVMRNSFLAARSERKTENAKWSPIVVSI